MRFPIETLRQVASRELFMPSTARVLSFTTTQDDYGGEAQVEQVKAVTRCRLEPGSGSEGVFRDAVRTTMSATVYLPFGTEVLASDYLEVDGRRFSVQAIAARSAGHSAHVEVAVSNVS